jgi:hypothetical protein
MIAVLDLHDAEYLTPVKIGGQKFEVILNTGSSDL